MGSNCTFSRHEHSEIEKMVVVLNRCLILSTLFLFFFTDKIKFCIVKMSNILTRDVFYSQKKLITESNSWSRKKEEEADMSSLRCYGCLKNSEMKKKSQFFLVYSAQCNVTSNVIKRSKRLRERRLVQHGSVSRTCMSATWV